MGAWLHGVRRVCAETDSPWGMEKALLHSAASVCVDQNISGFCCLGMIGFWINPFASCLLLVTGQQALLPLRTCLLLLTGQQALLPLHTCLLLLTGQQALLQYHNTHIVKREALQVNHFGSVCVCQLPILV